MLDASAVLALLKAEPGSEKVRTLMPGSSMSIVNLTETVAVACRQRLDVAPAALRQMLRDGKVRIIVPDEDTALLAAEMMGAKPPKKYGPLSLGDGYCLAHAAILGAPALTADQGWAETQFPSPVDIELIRN